MEHLYLVPSYTKPLKGAILKEMFTKCFHHARQKELILMDSLNNLQNEEKKLENTDNN
jgi:hypothetical protein